MTRQEIDDYLFQLSIDIGEKAKKEHEEAMEKMKPTLWNYLMGH